MTMHRERVGLHLVETCLDGGAQGASATACHVVRTKCCLAAASLREYVVVVHDVCAMLPNNFHQHPSVYNEEFERHTYLTGRARSGLGTVSSIIKMSSAPYSLLNLPSAQPPPVRHPNGLLDRPIYLFCNLAVTVGGLGSMNAGQRGPFLPTIWVCTARRPVEVKKRPLCASIPGSTCTSSKDTSKDTDSTHDARSHGLGMDEFRSRPH